MGAFAPVPLSSALCHRIDVEIVTPLLAELTRRDIPYRGVLYVGLMLTDDGPMVLEFNCRFGDPETQVVLPLLQGDFLTLVEATAEGRLADYLQGLPDAETGGPDGWPGRGMTDWHRGAVVVVGATVVVAGSVAVVATVVDGAADVVGVTVAATTGSSVVVGELSPPQAATRTASATIR